MAKSRATSSSTSTSNLVNFRLQPPALLQQLDALAIKNGESRGDCAKRLMLEAMNKSWIDQLQVRMDETDHHVHQLREDLATTVQAMLIIFAKEDPEKVQEWVAKHLLK